VSSKLKPTPVLDVPLGDARRRALDLVADRWALWLLLAIHETEGARFTDLAAEPGLSRRVLADRLRAHVHAGLVETEQYQSRPQRHRYRLTARGLQVRRLALALVHVAAGGALTEDPIAATAASMTPAPPHARAGGDAPPATHPADALLAGDPAAAARILDETVAPLIAYDDRYRTSLLDTLETWLACDASVSVTAARLYAHRHTIRYRLDRVRELTGLDPAATADRERLTLGLRARRVLQNPVPTANDDRSVRG
jgi:DNA-binding HxlR family transcriptional regulator